MRAYASSIFGVLKILIQNRNNYLDDVRFGPESGHALLRQLCASSHHLTKKETAEVRGGFFQYDTRSCALVEVSSWSLFQCVGDVLELRVERAADRIDGGDDYDRNTSGN